MPQEDFHHLRHLLQRYPDPFHLLKNVRKELMELMSNLYRYK